MLDLKTGTALSVIIPSSTGKGDDLVLPSSFEAEDQDGVITVTAPFYRSSIYPMRAGERCTVSYPDKTVMYMQDCSVLARVTERELHYVRLRPVGELRRIQRRENFRLPLPCPCSFSLYRQTNTAEGEEDVPAEGMLIDLSGGGASFLASASLPAGAEIILRFSHPELRTGAFRASVRWTKPSLAQDPYPYSSGVKFLHTGPELQDELTQFVFRQQLRERNLK